MRSNSSSPHTPMKNFGGGRTVSRFFGPRALEISTEIASNTPMATTSAPESPNSDVTVTPLPRTVPMLSGPFSPSYGRSKSRVLSGNRQDTCSISAVGLPDPFTGPETTTYTTKGQNQRSQLYSFSGNAHSLTKLPLQVRSRSSPISKNTPKFSFLPSYTLPRSVHLPSEPTLTATAPSFLPAQTSLTHQQEQHKLARKKWVHESTREITALAQNVKDCQVRYLITNDAVDYVVYLQAVDRFEHATSLEKKLEQRREIGLPKGMKPLKAGPGTLAGDAFQGLGGAARNVDGGVGVNVDLNGNVYASGGEVGYGYGTANGGGEGKLLGYRMALMEKTCAQVHESASRFEVKPNSLFNGGLASFHTQSQPHSRPQNLNEYISSHHRKTKTSTMLSKAAEDQQEAYEIQEQRDKTLTKLVSGQNYKNLEDLEELRKEGEQKSHSAEEKKAERKRLVGEIKVMTGRRMEKQKTDHEN